MSNKTITNDKGNNITFWEGIAIGFALFILVSALFRWVGWIKGWVSGDNISQNYKAMEIWSAKVKKYTCEKNSGKYQAGGTYGYSGTNYYDVDTCIIDTPEGWVKYTLNENLDWQSTETKILN